MRDEPVFRQWMEIGDAIVRRARGFSPLDAIYAPDKRISDPFDTLEHSHPALFMVQFALAKMLQAKGTRPDMLLGVSLGEFVAMSVAGMVPFEAALRFVARQPEIFAASAPAGALIAVLGPASLRESSAILAQASEVAGINADNHCVLACPAAETARVAAELRRLDVAFQPLPVPFAFHSRWVDSAEAAYRAAAAELAFETPFWPVWSARFARPLEAVAAAETWAIVRGEMRLQATIAAIEAQGGARYVDCSPTGTLAAVIRPVVGDRAKAVVSPFGNPAPKVADQNI